MSVVTKTGDDGKSRWLGKVVNKDSELLEAVGSLDELQAILGTANSSLREAKRRSNLDGIATPSPSLGLAMTQIQMDLYEIMAEIGYEKRGTINDKRIIELENEIDKIEKELEPLNKFLIFNNNIACQFNLARTVCRRAERRLVTLGRTKQIDPNILKYINRLSDYLFVLSRKYER
jgi:cob(I)alamin adenosyltransferase